MSEKKRADQLKIYLNSFILMYRFSLKEESEWDYRFVSIKKYI